MAVEWYQNKLIQEVGVGGVVYYVEGEEGKSLAIWSVVEENNFKAWGWEVKDMEFNSEDCTILGPSCIAHW